MYMLSCCLEGLGTPPEPSVVGEDFSAEQRTYDDIDSCGTQQAVPDLSLFTGLAEGKRLVQTDTTTTAEESTLFTEQCQALKDFSPEQAFQTAEAPPETESAQADAPQVNEEVVKGQETAADPAGVQYKGGYKDGKRHGYGILIRPCGARFEGEFRDDAANGYGTFYHPSGDVYAGQWQDNKAHGKGRFTHVDGSSYEGQWMMDVQEGYGVERWTDGSSYEGYYQAGKKSGEGRFRWPNGSTFEGQFKDNEINGEGTYKWKGGKTYTGQWVHNRMQGQGRMVMPDGRVHEGLYFQDRRHGKGRITWPDGHYFEGEWDAGEQVPGTGGYFDSSGRPMEALKEVPQQIGATAASSGKATTATSKSSRSPHVKEAEKNKQWKPTARHKVPLNDALATVGQQGVQSADTKGTVDGGSTAIHPEEQKHIHDHRVEQRDEGERAGKKSKRKSIQSTSPAQHNMTQQHSTSQHVAMDGKKCSNGGGLADTNGAGGSSVNPEKPGLAHSSDVVYARREDKHGSGGGKNSHPNQQHQQQHDRHLKEATAGPPRQTHPHQQHHQQYDRHLKEATAGPPRQNSARGGKKNSGSSGPTSHAAGGDNRKRRLFGRRR